MRGFAGWKRRRAQVLQGNVAWPLLASPRWFVVCCAAVGELSNAVRRRGGDVVMPPSLWCLAVVRCVTCIRGWLPFWACSLHGRERDSRLKRPNAPESYEGSPPPPSLISCRYGLRARFRAAPGRTAQHSSHAHLRGQPIHLH